MRLVVIDVNSGRVRGNFTEEGTGEFFLLYFLVIVSPVRMLLCVL